MKKLINIFFVAVILLCTGNLSAKVQVVNCNKGAKTSFAIITDAKTFENCKEAIYAYKNVLEKEGLGAYIVYANWATPEQVKEQIQKLAASKPILEGVVFLGDIPIARIRRGQHLTTAFKMNEKTFPMEESSVTSDRFYDCPDMKFEFIGKDSINPNFYYYNLSHNGSQVIKPAYYSARINVPELLIKTTGKDKYTYINDYLKKVVDAHNENNILDNFTYFAGHGYNSDCLTAWRLQHQVFKTYFPDAYKSSTGNTFLNFRQYPEMKFKLFDYMQDPNTDVFLFYEHGAPAVQYINGSYPAQGISDYIKVLKYELRAMYNRVKEDKKEAFVKDVCEHFGLDEQMFSAQSLANAAKEDSLMKFNKDIHLADLAKLKTGARFTMFNACYNGSFHQDGFVAGYHIFNDGKTIVTQGNTVNVLQDKWAEQLIGILALGARVGFWQNEVVTLESHLVGDPTYKFSPSVAMADDNFVKNINYNLVYGKADKKIWEDLLESKSPVLRALGVKQLQKIDNQSTQKIYEIFNTDRSMIVRLQALNALSVANSDLFIKALDKGLEDPYELINRLSCHWAGKTGAPELKAKLERLKKGADQIQRVNYAATTALDCYSDNRTPHPSKKSFNDDLRRLRNYPNNNYLPAMYELLKGNTINLESKLILCEALGWYNYSIKKSEIINFLKEEIANNKSIDPTLRNEMDKTISRLNNK